MKKMEQAREAIIEAFRQQEKQGVLQMTGLEVGATVQEIPVEPTRLHKLGNALLRLVGKEERPYMLNYSRFLYPNLMRLQDEGIVEATSVKNNEISEQSRVVYSLTWGEEE